MKLALLGKVIGDAKWLLFALVLLMFFFPWAFLWVSGKIGLPAFSNFLTNALPKEWQRLSGVSFSQVATPAGRAALVFVHPLVVFSGVIWTIGRGSDCVSGEIGRGTMEMLLAQPVRRTTVYSTQAFVTIGGSAVLALAAYCGTLIGLRAAPLYEGVPTTLFLAPTASLFALMFCLGGMTALVSSLDNLRWRTIGIMAGCYVLSTVMTLISQISDQWSWLGRFSFLTAYKPQRMVAEPDLAWSLIEYRGRAIVGLGLGGQVMVLVAFGAACYAAGAVVFNRREIPAPL